MHSFRSCLMHMYWVSVMFGRKNLNPSSQHSHSGIIVRIMEIHFPLGYGGVVSIMHSAIRIERFIMWNHRKVALVLVAAALAVAALAADSPAVVLVGAAAAAGKQNLRCISLSFFVRQVLFYAVARKKVEKFTQIICIKCYNIHEIGKHVYRRNEGEYHG